MPLQHVVKRGDSLWGLAGRHLGDFARWPELLEYHNDEVRKSGGNRGRVLYIKDPNLIFVGQILYLPIRDKHMMRSAKNTGTKAQAGKTAIPINLIVEYAIGDVGQPMIYIQEDAGQVIKTEMRGTISIQIDSIDRYRHNLELVLSENKAQCKQKLKTIYHPAFCKIVAAPVMKFHAGEMVINSPLAEMADAGPLITKLYYKESGHYTGTYKPRPMTGHLVIDGIQFIYYANIEFIINVKNSSDNPIESSGSSWSSGLAASFSKIVGGGGVYGVNLQSFSGGRQEAPYKYTGRGELLDLGASFESVWAWGSGPWKGEFRSVNGSLALFSGSFFWSPGEGGWIGFTFGFSLGVPGLAYEVTNYEESTPGNKIKHYKVPKQP